MPKLIKDTEIVSDTWASVDPESMAPGEQQILTLEQWLQAADKAGTAVQLEPGESPAPLFDHLNELALVAINFPVFTDGRGFSYARELRARGYDGELRATGHFIRDQLTYLHRCGFNAFKMDDEAELQEALGSLNDFTVHYQAAVDQPQPLFRRRS
tara:strand:- start:55074 stop:55541 length:468 start_codon:yes stop_codon:yes gene_type:complete